ncbi:TrbI/VirB10 family protein [Fortiea contorta]|uniref:TrbI/VirB10 family protein n=1 Tax=Fortiea contorta TaxID=1892405 RepID=UPI000345B3E5|nr:TrbI/VirB10 family protein [Fortiea contorta]
MTQASIPTTTQPKNKTGLNAENYQPEVESLDWEARMAKLVGFVEESSSINDKVAEDSAISQPGVSPSPEVRTEQPFASNPFAKLGFVGIGTLAVVMFAGGFLTQLMSSSNQKPSKNNIISPEVRSPAQEEPQPQALEAEIETLKTKLALTEQAEDVKAAQRTLRTTKITAPTPNVAVRDTKIPTPVKTVYVPQIARVERVVKVPPTLPILPPQPPVVKPAPPVVNFTPPSPPNPFDEWSRLAKIGSYGQINIADKANTNSASYQPPRNSEVQPAATNPRNNQITTPQRAAVVNPVQQRSPKSVVVGSSTRAVLATAIFGETTRSKNSDRNENEGESNNNNNVFVVRLQEPLKAADGTIAIPAKTELLTEIESISEQGLMQLKVVKMMQQINGSLSEQSLPQSALMLRAPQGKPLLAQQFPNRSSSIASMDLGLFVLGGLGKAAELINRTESQVITTTTAGTIINNSNPRNDISAGILEGGIKTIVPQIAQRNQQAISQMTQRSNIWFLPAGTTVELYVNQNLSI